MQEVIDTSIMCERIQISIIWLSVIYYSFIEGVLWLFVNELEVVFLQFMLNEDFNFLILG